ncbi:hypothetical protein SAMN06297229_0017 [Pseudidiomarina planktonica]|uniref:LPP20 lipoprotein n=1 Tax=Pseudidiomarina planktonica TaxID=1323738 RepID=A0A1Y6EAC1_9GAMM|nr:hypothetical protein [Pseudidiomarina planktonica]RUO66468.1 hypothetical protein CWI77_08640 [Pseudidiomarina planktonica]SMQ57870.1 hypothetical protein SAMN06297229_0017 [Pseudidiomarina planktonica]
MKISRKLQLVSMTACLTSVLSCAGVAQEPASQLLTAEACAYGRGASAIDAATTLANRKLAEQIQALPGEALAISAQQRNAAASAAKAGEFAPNELSGQLQGNDTCVSYQVDTDQLLSYQESQALGDVVWDDEAVAAVTVVGEGWADEEQGLTARQAAEYDALSRAVQMVAGAVIEDNFSADMAAKVPSRVLRSRRLRSSGVVQEFSYLGEQPLADNGFQVTLLVQVQAEPLLTELEQLFDLLGDPVVYIEPLPREFSAVQSHLAQAINELGLSVTEDAADALLTLSVDAQLREVSNGAQLALAVAVHNTLQQQLAVWRNQPHLITLPMATSSAAQLSEFHFAMQSQQQQLKDTIQQAAEVLYEQGG